MTRNLEKYEIEYLNQPYEHVQKTIRKDHIIEWLRSNELRGKILEIGCGNKSLVNFLFEFEEFHIIEPSKGFYELALDDASIHHGKDKIIVENCLLEDYNPNEEITFDVIIVSCLLHEIVNQEEFLLSIRRFMKKESLLYLDVPNANSFHRVFAVESGIIESVYDKSESQHRFDQNIMFSRESLRNLLQSVNFEIIELGTHIFKPFTHSQMQALMDEQIFDQKFLMNLAKMDKYIDGLGSEIFVVAKI